MAQARILSLLLLPLLQVLSWLSFDKSSVPKCLIAQTRILAFFYWSTFCILRARKNTFMRIRPPLSSEPLGMRPLPPPPPPTPVSPPLPPPQQQPETDSTAAAISAEPEYVGA